MTGAYPFIFAEDSYSRFRRHFWFWCCWWLSQAVLYSFAAGYQPVAYALRFPIAACESLVFLLAHMFLSYTLMYWLVPRFLLRGRYATTAVAVIALFICTGALASVLGLYVVAPTRAAILGPRAYPPHANEMHFFRGLLAGLRGAITIGGLAAAIKLMKFWYVEEQRNLELQRQNSAAQLQLLKAQVHPHFLFNTLNNIYANAHASPVAAGMIMGLSDLLRYMLYKGNQPLVPLRNELKMLQDYILLEQVRYGNNLGLNIELPDDCDHLQIAPLLLLPFLENAFKHGCSRMIDHPWISLRVVLDGDRMHMTLANARPEEEAVSTESGIGMHNAQRRLELIYPDRHEFWVVQEPGIFIVNLRLRLDHAPAVSEAPIPNHYAEAGIR